MHPSIHPTICLLRNTNIYASVCPSVYFCIHLSSRISMNPLIHFSVCTSIHLGFTGPYTHLSISLPIHTYTCPYFGPCIYPVACLSTYPGIHLSSTLDPSQVCGPLLDWPCPCLLHIQYGSYYSMLPETLYVALVTPWFQGESSLKPSSIIPPTVCVCVPYVSVQVCISIYMWRLEEDVECSTLSCSDLVIWSRGFHWTWARLDVKKAINLPVFHPCPCPVLGLQEHRRGSRHVLLFYRVLGSWILVLMLAPQARVLTDPSLQHPSLWNVETHETECSRVRWTLQQPNHHAL